MEKQSGQDWGKKAELHTPTDLFLKFEIKTPSGDGETARTRFGVKNNVFFTQKYIKYV